jgi:putative FmdB family regulatory protein
MEVGVMPIYEYGCDSCKHVFEEIQRFSDPDPDRCPSCGQSPVRRLISNSSFHLKGGGWYASNYEGGSTKSGSETSSVSPSTPSPSGTDAA